MAASPLQGSYYSGHADPTVPSLVLGSALTSGSTIWVIAFTYNQTISEPTSTSGSYTWTLRHAAGPTGDWRVAVYSAPNTSTSSSIGFRAGFPDGGSYDQVAVFESLDGDFLDAASSLQFILSDSWGPVDVETGGLVFAVGMTSGPTATIRLTSPTHHLEHDIGVNDAGGPSGSQSGAMGWDTTSSNTTFTADATISDFVAPYYNAVVISLSPAAGSGGTSHAITASGTGTSDGSAALEVTSPLLITAAGTGQTDGGAGITIVTFPPPPSFFAAGALSANNSGTTITAAIPASTIALRDVAIAVFTCNVSATFSTPSGWAILGTTLSNANFSMATFIKRLAGGDANPVTTTNVTFSNTQGGYGRVYVYRDVGGNATPVPQVANNGAPTTTNTPVTSAITTTVTNSRVVAIVGIDDDNSWSSGMPPTDWLNNGGILSSTTGADCAIDAISTVKFAAGSVSAVDVGVMSAADYWRTITFSLVPGALPVAASGTGQSGGSAAIELSTPTSVDYPITASGTGTSVGAAEIGLAAAVSASGTGQSGGAAALEILVPGQDRSITASGAGTTGGHGSYHITGLQKGASAIPDGNVSADLALIDGSWWYDWASYSTPNDHEETPGYEYVPQVWGDWILDERWGVGALGGNPLSQLGPADILLGFNEPDYADQGNMTVARALQLWPQLEATGARLGSPAPSADPGSLDWLADFMNGDGAGYVPRVDFICLHWYADLAANYLGPLDEFLDDMYALYQKPIWITEIGTLSGGNAAAATLISQVMTILSTRPWVERIAWYSMRDGGGYTGIGLVSGTGTLTGSGTVYASYDAVVRSTTPVSHAITASGTGQTGGSAEIRRTMPIAAAGTGQTSGAAALVRITTVTAAGTGQTSGNARFDLMLSASGTGQSAGSAALGVKTTITASGTGQTSGSANFTPIAMSAAGTGTSGGGASIALSTPHPITAAGTGTSTGSVAITIANGPIDHQLTGTGFSQSGGNVVTRGVLAVSGAGTGQSGGSATIALRPPFQAAGTGTFGGGAAIARTSVMSAAGTGTTGGSAALTRQAAIAASGSGQSGGTERLNLLATITASGTGTFGGGVDLRIPGSVATITASGTGTFGGSAAIALAVDIDDLSVTVGALTTKTLFTLGALTATAPFIVAGFAASTSVSDMTESMTVGALTASPPVTVADMQEAATVEDMEEIDHFIVGGFEATAAVGDLREDRVNV